MAKFTEEESSQTGELTVEGMQIALDSISKDEAIAIQNGEERIVVKFNQSNRCYEVGNNISVEGPKKLEKDENPGDITEGEKLDGTEQKPFRISCIEDLVAFSIMTRGGNSELNLASNHFSGKYVILERTLDFESIFSYNDYTTTKYGDLNEDGQIEELRKELTKKDNESKGFPAISDFAGCFDGGGNTIENIYRYDSANELYSVALFESYNNNSPELISNLKLKGSINTNSSV